MAASCTTCAYYLSVANECVHWDTRLDSLDGCAQWASENGALPSHVADSETVLRVQITKEADDVAKARQRTTDQVGLDRMDVLRSIVDEGLTQEKTAEKYGVTGGTISYHLRTALRDGIVKHVGIGKYEWTKGGGKSMAEQAIGRDEVQRM